MEVYRDLVLSAEDESQQWTALHAAIREARKAYQADGIMPDWEALSLVSDAVRTAVSSPTTLNGRVSPRPALLGLGLPPDQALFHSARKKVLCS